MAAAQPTASDNDRLSFVPSARQADRESTLSGATTTDCSAPTSEEVVEPYGSYVEEVSELKIVQTLIHLYNDITKHLPLYGADFVMF